MMTNHEFVGNIKSVRLWFRECARTQAGDAFTFCLAEGWSPVLSREDLSRSIELKSLYLLTLYFTLLYYIILYIRSVIVRMTLYC